MRGSCKGGRRLRNGLGPAPLITVVFALAVVFAGALSAPPGARAAFGFESVTTTFTGPGGGVGTLAAGSHPDSWSVDVSFETKGPSGEEQPDGALRDLRVALPPGLVGVVAGRARCSRDDFSADACPLSSRVGSFSFVSEEGPIQPVAVHLLEPSSGVAVQLGLHALNVPVIFDLTLERAPPHRLVAELTNAPQIRQIFAATLTLGAGPGLAPLMTLPRSCSGPLSTLVSATGWDPGSPQVAAEATGPIATDCASLPYGPELRIAPTTDRAGAPAGLDVTLDAPDPGILAAGGRAAADTASAALSLPPGLTLNPPAANGLAACTEEQLAAEQPDADPGTGCPQAAKIGTATVTTPLLEAPIQGDVYVAEPYRNPFGSLLALYLVLADPDRGVLLTLPVRLDADAGSGRLTADLGEIPELPISRVTLSFNSGPRAPLATPRECGTHATAYLLTPSSGNPPLSGSDEFSIGGNCDAGFDPSLSAGTVSSDAGAPAPLVFELAMPSSGPSLSALSVSLPPGLGASFAAVPPCPEQLVAGGDCPPTSRLGYARIAVGAGPEPLWIPAGGSGVYLAGPYRGAPYSIATQVSAQAGPFDLGAVRVRASIRIDPTTAAATVSVEDLPSIVDGVPLHYRALRLVLDRPGFLSNPTSCEPSQILARVSAAGRAPVTLQNPFQATGCSDLPFRPRLHVRLSRSSRNAHPGVDLVLRPRPRDANLAAAAFTLPKGLLLDPRRFPVLCTLKSDPADCPARTRVGRVRLWSPLVGGPLEGPIYIRTPAGRLPALTADLRLGDLRILLHGQTYSSRGRLRVGFRKLPDIAVSRARIALAGGSRGFLVNSADLCGRAIGGSAVMLGHNGKRRRFAGRQIVAAC